MNIKRNDKCICGSEKKYKHCCASKSNSNRKNPYLRMGIITAIFLLILFSVYAIYESFNYPEQEYYKCENPNCTQLHKRVVTNPSTKSDN